MQNYIVIKKGVYLQDLWGVWHSESEAIAAAKRHAAVDKDDYHTYYVLPIFQNLSLWEREGRRFPAESKGTCLDCRPQIFSCKKSGSCREIGCAGDCEGGTHRAGTDVWECFSCGKEYPYGLVRYWPPEAVPDLEESE